MMRECWREARLSRSTRLLSGWRPRRKGNVSSATRVRWPEGARTRSEAGGRLWRGPGTGFADISRQPRRSRVKVRPQPESAVLEEARSSFFLRPQGPAVRAVAADFRAGELDF